MKERILKILNSNRTLLYFLIIFNIFNVIDKITTYIGVSSGFIETNTRMVHWFNILGVLPTVIIQTFIVAVCSFGVYFAITRGLTFLKKALIVPNSYLISNYFLAIVSNVRCLI